MQAGNTDVLDLMTSPVFVVKENTIVHINEAAARILLREGTPVADVLETGAGEYAALGSGCLYLTVCIAGQVWGAAVSRTGDGDIFVLDPLTGSPELQALALAARELRGPLSEAMNAARNLAGQETAGLARNLNRLLRLVGNMSDAGGLGPSVRPEATRMDAFLREITEKAAALSDGCGSAIRYEGPDAEVTTFADRQQLERAVLNLISNAMKFTEQGTVTVRLSRHGSLLRLSVSDTGSGIPEEILGTVFRRHLRQPVIEDSRQGIGLGMLLVRSCAASHGGAVLIDRPEGMGTRVTMTLPIRTGEPEARKLSSLKVDYAGEWDHALLELSDCLGKDVYRKY